MSQRDTNWSSPQCDDTPVLPPLRRKHHMGGGAAATFTSVTRCTWWFVWRQLDFLSFFSVLFATTASRASACARAAHASVRPSRSVACRLAKWPCLCSFVFHFLRPSAETTRQWHVRVPYSSSALRHSHCAHVGAAATVSSVTYRRCCAVAIMLVAFAATVWISAHLRRH